MAHPELREFLRDQDLEAGCTIQQIGQNYKGQDRPKKGLNKWLERVECLEVFAYNGQPVKKIVCPIWKCARIVGSMALPTQEWEK